MKPIHRRVFINFNCYPNSQKNHQIFIKTSTISLAKKARINYISLKNIKNQVLVPLNPINL